jgi:hypothetical protein
MLGEGRESVKNESKEENMRCSCNKKQAIKYRATNKP